MPLPEPDHATAAAPEAPRHPLRATTLAWLALVLLTGLSVLAAGLSHGGPGGAGGPTLLSHLLSVSSQRLVMTAVVAAIAWVKALLLIRHYLHARAAGPRFYRIVLLFTALAPLGLVLSALREAWLA